MTEYRSGYRGKWMKERVYNDLDDLIDLLDKMDVLEYPAFRKWVKATMLQTAAARWANAANQVETPEKPRAS